MKNKYSNKIAIGADHGGFRLKEKLKPFLKQKGFMVDDFGTFSKEPCDYPKIGIKLVKEVSRGKFKRAILICKTGIGFSILANRFRNVRAALCYSLKAARLSRQHNNSNVLIMAASFVKESQAKRIIGVWLETEFLGGRHSRRMRQIERYC